MLTHEDHKYPICAGMPRMSIDLIPLASEKILLCLQYTPSWFALTCSLCNEIAACLIELHWPGLLSGCSFHDILVSLYRPTGADNAISSGIMLCDWFGSVRIQQLTKPLLYSVVGQPEDSWSLSIVCTVLNACTGPQTSVGGHAKSITRLFLTGMKEDVLKRHFSVLLIFFVHLTFHERTANNMGPILSQHPTIEKKATSRQWIWQCCIEILVE